VNDGDLEIQTTVYLFNDLLIIAEDQESNVLECIEVSRIFVRKAVTVTGYNEGMEIFTSDWTRVFGMQTQAERDQWIEDIEKAAKVLTELHPLHTAQRLQAMKDLHATRKMSVGERTNLFEHIATAHRNRGATPSPLAPGSHFNVAQSISAPLSAHVMVEKMKQQQADLMRENHFLFEKVESHPQLRRSNTVLDFVKRLSQSGLGGPKGELPTKDQVIKAG